MAQGFLEKLRKALKPETMALIEAEVGDDFDWSVVPYERFKTVNDTKNTLKARVDELEQKDDTSKQFTQEDINAAVKARETELTTQFDTQMTGMKIRDVALSKLRAAGALDAELIYDSPKIAKDTLKFNAKGDVDGIEDFVKGWKESKPALFTDFVPDGTGKSGGKEGNVDSAIDKALAGVFSFPVSSEVK